MRELINEVWALRGGEHVTILPERPEGGCWIAVGLFSAALPPGPRARARGGELSSEDAAVLGCKLTPEGEWQWVHLSSATKETMADLLFDEVKAELGRWYYCVLTTATAVRILPLEE